MMRFGQSDMKYRLFYSETSRKQTHRLQPQIKAAVKLILANSTSFPALFNPETLGTAP